MAVYWYNNRNLDEENDVEGFGRFRQHKVGGHTMRFINDDSFYPMRAKKIYTIKIKNIYDDE